MTDAETTQNLEEVLVAGIKVGEATQGKGFEFTRPEGRTAEEGLTLPELVFQALGAAYAEGIAVGLDGGKVPEEDREYSNVINVGHQLLAHVADQARR